MTAAPSLALTERSDLSKQAEAVCDKHAGLVTLKSVSLKDTGTTPGNGDVIPTPSFNSATLNL